MINFLDLEDIGDLLWLILGIGVVSAMGLAIALFAYLVYGVFTGNIA